ncbi:hypothetical protein [Paenibacillus marinisediminis]
MFWTKEKLDERIMELSDYRYRDAIVLEEFYFLDECSMVHSAAPMPAQTPHSMEGAGTIRLGHHWEGRDLYAWLQKDVLFPIEWVGRKIVGIFDFGQSS